MNSRRKDSGLPTVEQDSVALRRGGVAFGVASMERSVIEGPARFEQSRIGRQTSSIPLCCIEATAGGGWRRAPAMRQGWRSTTP